MSDELSVHWQGQLVRCVAGDAPARGDLLQLAYARLHALARVLLNESFPRLKAAPAPLETTD